MSALNIITKSPNSQLLFRQDVEGDNSAVLTDIYQDDTNIVVWQRTLAHSLAQAADSIIDSQPSLEKLLVVAPQDASAEVEKALGCSSEAAVLAGDIAQLVDMFCCLFDLKRAVLRFSVLDRAMCPRFHVDHVPCRLITTYQGIATEWLPHGFRIMLLIEVNWVQVIWENPMSCPACMITPAISNNWNSAMLLYLRVSYGITMRAQGLFIAHRS